MASQLEVFPLRVVEFMPLTAKGMKHAAGRAIVEGGEVYYVKGIENGPVCATEWVAAYVAQSLNLAVPEHAVLQMLDGMFLFGSRAVLHPLSALETSRLLFSSDAPNNIAAPTLVESCSALFAFDLAIGNTDRHLDNFLLSADGPASASRRVATLRPIDFAASDLLNSEMHSGPMSKMSHTVQSTSQIRELKGFRDDIAISLLSRLDKGRETLFENALHGLPQGWLPNDRREALMKRIMSHEFSSRLAQVNQGLSDGTYF